MPVTPDAVTLLVATTNADKAREIAHLAFELERLNFVAAVEQVHHRSVETAREEDFVAGSDRHLLQFHDGVGKRGVGAALARMKVTKGIAVRADPQLAGHFAAVGDEEVFGRGRRDREQ